MASVWDSERLNAKGLLRYLADEFIEEDAQRRDGLKHPSPKLMLHLRTLKGSYRSCTFEIMMKMQSFRFLQTYVERSVEKLQRAGDGDQPVYNGQTEVVEALGKLSDQGVVEALPGLLEKMERKALLSINVIVSGKEGNIRNRAHLINKIKKFFDEVYLGQPGHPMSKPLQDVVTISRCPESYKKMESKSIELDASSPVEAAQSALSQVHQLPLRDLHVMLGTLKNSRPPKIGQPKVGGNKDRLASSIVRIAESLLPFEGVDELPPRLRKSLIVMSLSARHSFGNDGKLIDFLGPISAEKQSLHYSILSALSDVNYVKKDNLLLLYEDLVAGDVSSRTKMSTIRSRITTIFLDCLLNSERRRVPEYVKRAAENLKGMMRYQSVACAKSKCVTANKDLHKRTRLELEAVLRVSGHLQQILQDLSEYSEGSFSTGTESDLGRLTSSRDISLNTDPSVTGRLRERPSGCDFPPVKEVGVATAMSQDVVKEQDYLLDDDTGRAMNKQIQIWSPKHTPYSLNGEDVEEMIEQQVSCDHEALSPGKAKWLRDITRIGDEAAGIGYTLIGCAIEEMSRLTGQRLETPVKSYLRSGTKRRSPEADAEGGQDCCDQDQVAFILSLAQNDPRISRRTMDRVKRRLLR